MSITPFNMIRDINGFNGFGLPFSNSKWQTTLLAGVEQTLTVPIAVEAMYPNLLAVFSFDPGDSVWVGINNTATLPGSSFSQCNCELNPAARAVKVGDVLHFITSDTSDQIGVIFYAIT